MAGVAVVPSRVTTLTPERLVLWSDTLLPSSWAASTSLCRDTACTLVVEKALLMGLTAVWPAVTFTVLDAAWASAIWPARRAVWKRLKFIAASEASCTNTAPGGRGGPQASSVQRFSCRGFREGSSVRGRCPCSAAS